MSRTPYMETEALLAVMEDDEGAARAILAQMLPGELVTLSRQAERLAELAAEEQ